MMYRWLRNTHLFLGLFSSLFVLMYGISSIRMAHHSWFPAEPEVTRRQIAIPPDHTANARAVARYLMDEQGLRGEVGGGRQSETGFRFEIGRPGTFHLIDYSRASGEANIETRVTGFVALLHHIHETAGLYHDYTLPNIWGGFVGLVSLSLIALALTGIYLWFKIHSERRIGAILLVISLGYSLTVMVLLRLA